MTDIVERISQLPELANLPGGALAADCFEAAIEIKQLRAENEKLRAALKPFAQEAAMYTDHAIDEVWVSEGLQLGVYRAAAAALKETGDERRQCDYIFRRHLS